MKTTNLNTSPPILKGIKKWAIAKMRCGRIEGLHNNNIEVAYHRILSAVKTLYLKPGETYFERDYKADKTESLLAMHRFVCTSFYWILDCELAYNYRIYYAFGNCPFEQEIRKLLRNYPFYERATEVVLQPNVAAFYKRVVAHQDKRHIYLLKVE